MSLKLILNFRKIDWAFSVIQVMVSQASVLGCHFSLARNRRGIALSQDSAIQLKDTELSFEDNNRI